MVRRNNQIIAEILSMDDKQLEEFIANLKPETLEYLDIILEKAEKNTINLKKYLKVLG